MQQSSGLIRAFKIVTIAAQMRTFLTFSALAAMLTSVPAAVITLTPGAARTDDPVTGVNDWTLDAGLVVTSLPASPNCIIFEAGGDGTGSALALVGSDLVYYYDIGDFLVSTPANDKFMTVDISAFAGSVISIRLDADLSTASDTITLTATDGSTTVTDSVTPDTNVFSIAGGNDTGFGVVAADLAGLDESAEPGFPNMAQFQNASYFVGGANAHGADALAGTLYTTLADQPPGALPDPASWGLAIPEPGSSVLVGSGLALMLLRRRRG